MSPLFAAIAHGCAAEREEETFVELYWPRIAHGEAYFATRKLGLYGQELAVLANFFETPFTAPSPRLTADHRGLILNLGGFRLRALGRLEDAVATMRAAIGAHIEEQNWEEAALDSGNLSELLVTIGSLSGAEGAIAAGEAAAFFADRSGVARRRIVDRTTHSDALLQAGALAPAGALLREAEALQKERESRLPRLYSLQGYRTCDLLLARGRAAEAAARIRQIQTDWAKRPGWRSSVLRDALYETAAARAALAANPSHKPALLECAARSAEAVAALRRANDEDYFPRGLLAHAEALWRCGDADAAGDPLSEAEDIAARGPMPLYLTQAHLLRARIALAGQGAADARPYRDRAAALIGKHGYGRAVPELAVLDAEIACAANAPAREAAIAAALTAAGGEPYHDARTGRTISGGWFGLLPRLEAILPPSHAGLAQLQAARDAYNAERDDYLRSTLAKDVEGYDPEGDPIAAYLAKRDN